MGKFVSQKMQEIAEGLIKHMVSSLVGEMDTTPGYAKEITKDLITRVVSSPGKACKIIGHIAGTYGSLEFREMAPPEVQESQKSLL